MTTSGPGGATPPPPPPPRPPQPVGGASGKTTMGLQANLRRPSGRTIGIGCMALAALIGTVVLFWAAVAGNWSPFGEDEAIAVAPRPHSGPVVAPPVAHAAAPDAELPPQEEGTDTPEDDEGESDVVADGEDPPADDEADAEAPAEDGNFETTDGETRVAVGEGSPAEVVAPVPDEVVDEAPAAEPVADAPAAPDCTTVSDANHVACIHEALLIARRLTPAIPIPEGATAMP